MGTITPITKKTTEYDDPDEPLMLSIVRVLIDHGVDSPRAHRVLRRLIHGLGPVPQEEPAAGIEHG